LVRRRATEFVKLANNELAAIDAVRKQFI